MRCSQVCVHTRSIQGVRGSKHQHMPSETNGRCQGKTSRCSEHTGIMQQHTGWIRINTRIRQIRQVSKGYGARDYAASAQEAGVRRTGSARTQSRHTHGRSNHKVSGRVQGLPARLLHGIRCLTEPTDIGSWHSLGSNQLLPPLQ